MTHRDAVGPHHTTSKRRPRLIAAIGLAATAVAVGGSGSASGLTGAELGSTASAALRADSLRTEPRTAARPASSGEECLPLGDKDLDEADGSLVVLVDATASSADQTDRVESLVKLVDDTTADHDLSVAVGSFGGSDAEVRFAGCLDGAVFVADGNNARTRERNRPDLIDGLTDLFDSLPDGYESSDPTSALRAGIDRFAGAPDGPKLLVIHTDGIPTTGCAALPEQVDIDDPELIDGIVASCADAGQLPDASGVEIVVGGIGRTDNDLDSGAVTFLIDLNTALCEASGATCTIDPNLPTSIWPDESADDLEAGA